MQLKEDDFIFFHCEKTYFMKCSVLYCWMRYNLTSNYQNCTGNRFGQCCTVTKACTALISLAASGHYTVVGLAANELEGLCYDNIGLTGVFASLTCFILFTRFAKNGHFHLGCFSFSFSAGV